PPARPRGGDRRAGHLGDVQQPHGAGLLAALLRSPGGDGAGRRADVRPGAQPRAERAVLVPDPAALRSAARTARAAGPPPRAPAVRGKLSAGASAAEYGRGVGAESRRPDYDWIFLMEDPTGPHRSVAELARQRGLDPVEAMIQLAAERDLRCFFVQPLFNEN